MFDKSTKAITLYPLQSWNIVMPLFIVG